MKERKRGVTTSKKREKREKTAFYLFVYNLNAKI